MEEVQETSQYLYIINWLPLLLGIISTSVKRETSHYIIMAIFKMCSSTNYYAKNKHITFLNLFKELRDGSLPYAMRVKWVLFCHGKGNFL